MHCNLRQPELRQPFPALTTTWCQVWSYSTYPVPYYSVFAADTLLQAVTSNFNPVTLTFELERLQLSLVTWWNSLPHLNAIRSGVIAILVFYLMILNIVLRVALGSGIIFTKFDLRQLICAWIIAYFLCWYVMSRCDLDLWPVDLESLWDIKRHVIKVCTKFQQNRAIPGWIIYW